MAELTSTWVILLPVCSEHNGNLLGGGPELGSLTGGGGAAVPYGEQRYNERRHLLAWTPKDSRTKLHASKSLMHFYRFWNVSGMAAAFRVNRLFTAVWPGYQLASITSLSQKKQKPTASSLKTSQRRSQAEICHRASNQNARSTGARAICLTPYPPIRLAEPSVALYIDSCRPESSAATACLRTDAAGDNVH